MDKYLIVEFLNLSEEILSKVFSSTFFFVTLGAEGKSVALCFYLRSDEEDTDLMELVTNDDIWENMLSIEHLKKIELAKVQRLFRKKYGEIPHE